MVRSIGSSVRISVGGVFGQRLICVAALLIILMGRYISHGTFLNNTCLSCNFVWAVHHRAVFRSDMSNIASQLLFFLLFPYRVYQNWLATGVAGKMHKLFVATGVDR